MSNFLSGLLGATLAAALVTAVFVVAHYNLTPPAATKQACPCGCGKIDCCCNGKCD